MDGSVSLGRKARLLLVVGLAGLLTAISFSLYVQKAHALLGGFIQPLAEPQIRVVWQNGPDCVFTSALKSGGAKDKWRGQGYFKCTGRIPPKMHVQIGTRAGTFLQEYGPRTFRDFLGASSGSAIGGVYGPSAEANYNPNGLYPPIADAVFKIRNVDAFPAFGLPSLHCYWSGQVGAELVCVTQSTVDGK